MLGKKSLLVLVLCSSLSFLVLGFDELNDEDVTDEMTEEFKTFFQTISYIHIPKNGGYLSPFPPLLPFSSSSHTFPLLSPFPLHLGTEMEKIIQRLSGLSFGWRSYLDGTTNKTNWHVCLGEGRGRKDVERENDSFFPFVLFLIPNPSHPFPRR